MTARYPRKDLHKKQSLFGGFRSEKVKNAQRHLLFLDSARIAVIKLRCNFFVYVLSATDGTVDYHRGTESLFADRLGAESKS